ncbi:MAG TPA: hypothetical protein VMW52_09180 [Phycisphaerae bacterium]|nr:hypothetical protein [Phycisphaerae bacterium]
MPPTKTVSYHDEEIDVRLTIARADIRAGMRRTRLQLDADAHDKGKKARNEDPDVRLLRRFTYPDLMAATVEASGIPWPLGFEDYLALPERLGLAWEQAVYELNPHWLPPASEETASDEKKEPARKSTAA